MNYSFPAKARGKISTISRVYTFYNQYFHSKGDEEFANYHIIFGNINKYRMLSIAGSGKYSLVFAGHCARGYCAIKVLKDVAYPKVQKELYILNRVSSSLNVVHVYDVIRDELTGAISIVTEFVNAGQPRILYPKLTFEEIRYYMFILLKTLDLCHSKGVMHRDIKPGNVLIDNDERTIKIIDWGLADLYYPMKQYSVRVSTMRYKAPELLLDYRFYDYGVDIWGVGCILAEMLFGVGFIKGNSYEEVLTSIASLWGKHEIYQYAEKYCIEIPASFLSGLETCNKPKFNEKIKQIRANVFDPDIFDLLKKLLTVDHGERITAREAIRHKFFKPYSKLLLN